MNRYVTIKAAIGALLLMFSSSCAWPVRGCFPSKNKRQRHSGGINEAQFNAAVDLVEKAYRFDAAIQGFELIFVRDWENDIANSWTETDENKWVVYAFGGLARIKGMTQDAYVLVACHEIGHHLGGAPLYPDSDWAASSEGAADYWSTLECGKRVFRGDKKRLLAASETLMVALAKLGKEPVPRIESSDPYIARKTDNGHAPAQCRLDTLVAGIMCDVPDAPMSSSDPRINSCHKYAPRPEQGSRPRCWYKPVDEI